MLLARARASVLPGLSRYTECPNLVGTMPRLLRARQSCSAESGRRSEVDQPLRA